jgi:hypothetical protein
MVELAQGSTQLSLHKPDEVGLLRSRLQWVARPLGALLLILWVMHPAVADRPEWGQAMLLGFLLGALYGLVLYGKHFKHYMVLRPVPGRQQSNRVPAEYYWGEISGILFENKR